MMENPGKLTENTEVRLSELAHESKSAMFLTPSGDVFWRPVGDMYEMCVCVSVNSVCVEYVKCEFMCLCRKRNRDIWPVNFISE